MLAEVSTPGRIVIELPLIGDGNTLEHALMLPTRDDNRPEPGGNIRLALAEPPPGAEYRVSIPSSGYLIAVKDKPPADYGLLCGTEYAGSLLRPGVQHQLCERQRRRTQLECPPFGGCGIWR